MRKVKQGHLLYASDLYPLSELATGGGTSNISSSKSKFSPLDGAGGSSSRPAVEQINYYAWDRSSKASKLAARGPGSLAHPKRDRRARDYLSAQLFGDSDPESSLDVVPPLPPQRRMSGHAQSGSGLMSQEKVVSASVSPPSASQPPAVSYLSSGNRIHGHCYFYFLRAVSRD